MGTAEWTIAIAGLGVLFAFWSVRAFRRSGGNPDRSQEVRVRVKGGFSPERIVVPAGVPLRLVFLREETASTSESVVFADFGKSVMLPPYHEVVVDLPACEPGEHEFASESGLLHGRLVVKAGHAARTHHGRARPRLAADR